MSEKKSDERWFEGFFEGLALDMWRHAVPPETTRAEVDWLERVLELPPGARVLDVPCGQGRHAIELAARGHRVTGVDVSHHMLEAARHAAKDALTEVEWIEADMRALSANLEATGAADGAFDGALCTGNSFGYLVPAATKTFLGTIARSLAPGGRLALDYGMAAECVLPRFREREWVPIGDILFLEENVYHVEEGVLETRYTFVKGDRVEHKVGRHHVHTVREVLAMLAETGFEVVSVQASTEGAPFELGSPCLYVVARRR